MSNIVLQTALLGISSVQAVEFTGLRHNTQNATLENNLNGVGYLQANEL
jgi:hypothetical protein